MRKPYRTVLHVSLEGEPYFVSGKYTSAFGPSADEPGEPEHFEIEGIRDRFGELVTEFFDEEDLEKFAAECLKQCRDD